MTEEDVKRLIEFRASNEALFTGKRNSAKIAWRYVTYLYISNNCERVAPVTNPCGFVTQYHPKRPGPRRQTDIRTDCQEVGQPAD